MRKRNLKYILPPLDESLIFMVPESLSNSKIGVPVEYMSHEDRKIETVLLNQYIKMVQEAKSVRAREYARLQTAVRSDGCTKEKKVAMVRDLRMACQECANADAREYWAITRLRELRTGNSSKGLTKRGAGRMS